jgi:hypothetical protein
MKGTREQVGRMVRAKAFEAWASEGCISKVEKVVAITRLTCHCAW